MCLAVFDKHSKKEPQFLKGAHLRVQNSRADAHGLTIRQRLTEAHVPIRKALR